MKKLILLTVILIHTLCLFGQTSIESAYLAINKHQFNTALFATTKILNIDSLNGDAQAIHTYCTYRIEQVTKKYSERKSTNHYISKLKKAITNDANLEKVSYFEAHIRHNTIESKNLKIAYEKISKAISINHNNKEYFLLRATIIENGALGFDTENLLKSNSDLSKAILLENNKTKKAEIHYRKAKNFQFNGKLYEATIDGKKCLSLNPNHKECLFIMAKCYFNFSEYDKAISYLNKLIPNSKEPTTYYLLRADCYYELNKFQEAINDYTKSIPTLENIYIESNYQNLYKIRLAETLQARGGCYYMLEKNNLACSDWKKAKTLSNDNSIDKWIEKVCN